MQPRYAGCEFQFNFLVNEVKKGPSLGLSVDVIPAFLTFISSLLQIYFPERYYKHVVCTLDSFRSSPPEVFLGKGVPKKCSKFTGEHPC